VVTRPASLAPFWGSFNGHYFTIVPSVLPELRARLGWLVGARYAALPFSEKRLAASGVEPARVFQARARDPELGSVAVTGLLHAPPGAKRLLLCVHGLGGSSQSVYLLPALQAAAARGWACLRLDMRGANGNGEDFYHAGLTADLHAALASPELAQFTDVYVLGYSLGGHLALRLGAEPHDTRVRALAAICAPIDLARSAAAIDRPELWLYRQHVLRHLKRSYAEVARRRTLPTPLARVLAVQTLRDWDACTVVPRYGFASTADYHARASAAPHLGALRAPALLLNTVHDPMVPLTTIVPALPAQTPRLDVRWLSRGGHVGFPRAAHLGEDAPPGLEAQVLAWLDRAGQAAPPI
jgi:predicted alpha/beta-fold hydrolase